MPRRTRSVTSSVENGRAALGISTLPGFEREHGLVRLDRPLARHVAVADRTAVRVEEVEPSACRRRSVDDREPQPLRVGEAARAAAPARARAGRARPVRRRTRGAVVPVRRLAHLDEEQAAGQLAREVHDDGIAVGQAGVDRGGHRRRGVDDEQVAGRGGSSPRASKRACTGAASPALTSSRTWSRRRPAASGGWWASCAGSSTKPSGAGRCGRLDHGCPRSRRHQGASAS